ncbi:Plasma membrane fusion protein prm1 [Penicillium taxi]|uniref:Plasma membrane fusion protein prm1 n=1 Tax=Penicillium taxi TaxID=168475 RepID=UPI00254570AF|nr:Plasma membrane fusion protein prm1 [Penicillium taxi]KAJ5899694.1 Plasma membrane fusion protein prm1 [Penicillium taxi]
MFRPGRSIFPLLPPYGVHDPSKQGRIIPLHPDGLTPYLGLRARLSQVWINRWTILLLLVLVRVLLAIGSVRNDMAAAKREALSACTSVETMGSAMASMPHYLASGVNDLAVKGINESVGALNTMLQLVITGVEEIVLFIIKIMYQTYLCLITLAVRGAVDVATALLEDVVSALNSTIKAVESDIQSTVKTFESGLDDFSDLVSSAAKVLGASIPTLNLNSSMDGLTSWSIPSSVNSDISDLNKTIPTFSEVQNFTENIIKLPFEEVKKLVNISLGNYSFDRSALSVPVKKQLTFCDDNDGINSFFDGATDIAITARKIFIAVIVVAAILACIPVAWQEIRRWRHMKERSELVRREAHDPMDVVYIVSRPYTAAAGIKAASHFSNSRRQILVRWAVAYATSLPALFVLAIGIAALLACLCQYILLKVIAKTVPELTTEVGAFADKVVVALNNASNEWADGANSAINSFDTKLNDNIFGWVNTSTSAVNSTLNTFVEKTTGVLNDTFGGTIFYDPIEEVFNCLIGLKIASVQKGLTWVHDNAHIDFPNFPDDIFSKGASDSISNSSDPSDSFLAGAGDSTSNKITEVVVDLIEKLEEALRQETLIATAVFAIWVLIVLIGVIRAMFLWWGHDRNRGEGGGHAMDAVPSHPGPISPADSQGFTSVPLTAIPRTDNFSGTSEQTAGLPRYERTQSEGFPESSPVYERHERTFPGAAASGSNNPFIDSEYPSDEKVGFAGQRTALQVEASSDTRKSNYVEYGEKH